MNTPAGSENFGRICRACMYKEEKAAASKKRTGRRAERQEELTSIFAYPAKNETQPIVELLASCMPTLHIQETDELPKLICAVCLDKLLAMHQFQQTCLRSDQHMRNLLEYSAVEAKYTQADEILATAEIAKLADADPLLASEIEGAVAADVSVSIEDVRNFLKLEIEEQAAAGNTPLQLPESVSETLKLEGEHAIETEATDESDDDDSDWVMEQPAVPAVRKKKTKKPLEYDSSEKLPVKSELETELEASSSNESNEDGANSKHTESRPSKQTPAAAEANNSAKYKCDKCPRKYKKSTSLQRHKDMHEKGQIKEHNCDICDKKFMKRYSLNRHKRSHALSKDGQLVKKREIPRPYVCEFCNKAFQQSCTLKDHIRVHTGEQPFLCSECGKAFNSASNMKQHLLRHTGLKRYECPECPKKFPCLSDLASHKAVHRKHKPHVCDICGAAFGKPFQLKKHKMYHNGEKPHKCEYCEMRFVCADHMRRHQRTHTGEKPYKCKYCERAFAQSNDLIKHLRSHLGENVYKCELCPNAYRLASELREHFAGHKNEDEATREHNLKALLEEEARLRISLLGPNNAQEQGNNVFCV